jgi:hypothetical protein
MDMINTAQQPVKAIPSQKTGAVAICKSITESLICMDVFVRAECTFCLDRASEVYFEFRSRLKPDGTVELNP